MFYTMIICTILIVALYGIDIVMKKLKRIEILLLEMKYKEDKQ